jgi:cytidyltransferase-like protein
MKRYEVGLFPMCGDLLHAGHILALREAKARCNHLIVGLNTHPDGKSPVQTVLERLTQLQALRCVDEVIPYQGRKDMELIAATLDYEVRFLGSDYIDKDWDGKEQEAKRGIEPYFIKRDHGLSSTELKERILRSAKQEV